MPARVYTLYKTTRPTGGIGRALLTALALGLLLGGWIALSPRAEATRPVPRGFAGASTLMP